MHRAHNMRLSWAFIFLSSICYDTKIERRVHINSFKIRVMHYICYRVGNNNNNNIIMVTIRVLTYFDRTYLFPVFYGLACSKWFLIGTPITFIICVGLI